MSAMPEPHDRASAPVRGVAAPLLIAAMGVGSIVMWCANPIFWLWLASKMTSSSQPSIGPYLLVLAGTVVTMVVIGKGLGRLNALYGRITGQGSSPRAQLPWLRSMRGERVSTSPTTVLDVVMIVSVALALVVMGIWFFFFAGSSLPT